MKHDPSEYPAIDTLPCQKERIEARDWDVLAVFDACRWDIMHEWYSGQEPVEQVRTPARRSTPDWVTRVWDQPGWEDVTYVSANPFTQQVAYMDRYGADIDARLTHIKAWEDDCWDDARGTVHASDLTDAALDYDPPLVIHYIQPHTPFIGDVSYRATPDSELVPAHDGEDITATGTAYKLVQAGHISPAFAREAYRANAHVAFREMHRLADEYATCVFTADHGEALGPDDWSHGGLTDPRARIVPWLEVTNGNH